MRPIRHESQVYGLFHTVKEDREFGKSTNPKEEPVMKDTCTGRQHNFDPYKTFLLIKRVSPYDPMACEARHVPICLQVGTPLFIVRDMPQN